MDKNNDGQGHTVIIRLVNFEQCLDVLINGHVFRSVDVVNGIVYLGDIFSADVAIWPMWSMWYFVGPRC